MTDQYGLVLEHVWPIILAVMLLVWAGATAAWLENRGLCQHCEARCVIKMEERHDE